MSFRWSALLVFWINYKWRSTIAKLNPKCLGLAGADDWESAKLDEAYVLFVIQIISRNFRADFHKGVHNEISPYIFVLSGYRQGDRVGFEKDVLTDFCV